MKRFNELSPNHKEKAIQFARSQVVESIIDMPELFDKNIYDKSMIAHNKMQIAGTPWFIYEAIYEELRDEVNHMALKLAKEAYYPSPDDVVLNLT